MKKIVANLAFAVFAIIIWVGLASPSIAAEKDLNGPYVTWPPIEPDKAVAAWLIKKYVAPDARFVFVERGTSISQGIPFDVPGSKYVRDQHRCASETIIQSYRIQDDKASQLANLARRVEIAYWCASFTEAENTLIDNIRNVSAAVTNNESGLMQAVKLVDEWTPQMNPTDSNTTFKSP